MDRPEVCCMTDEDFLKRKPNEDSSFSKRPNRLVVVSQDAKKKTEGGPESLVQVLEDLERQKLEIEKNMDDEFIVQIGMNESYYSFTEEKLRSCYALRPENDYLKPLTECLESKPLGECKCEFLQFRDSYRAESDSWIHETAKKTSPKKNTSSEQDSAV